DAAEVPLCTLRQDGHASYGVGARLEIAARLTVSAASLVAGPHTARAAVRDEQLVRRRLRKDHRPARLRLFGEPAAEPRQRCDIVAVVLHRRRRRDAKRALSRQEVDGLVLDRAVEGHLVDPLASLEETAERARIDNCSGQEMRAGLFPLVEAGDGNLAEPFPDLGRVLEQLAETDRTREPSRARADDEDTDLDALVGRVARRRDVVRRPKRRWDV